MREGHPRATSPLSLAQFVEFEHAVVQASGRSQEIFEELLKRHHIKRKVFLTTPHFLSIPALFASSDLIVTVPHAMGIVFGRHEYGLQSLVPPFSETKIELKQFWHRNYNKAPRLLWLRQMVAELFNDTADEWNWQDSTEAMRPCITPYSDTVADKLLIAAAATQVRLRKLRRPPKSSPAREAVRWPGAS